MTQEQFNVLPPSERLTRQRAISPPVTKARREPPQPPADLVDAWAKLPPVQRRTKQLE